MVKHILKNGKEVKDITGHIVRKKDVPSLYELLKKRKNNESTT